MTSRGRIALGAALLFLLGGASGALFEVNEFATGFATLAAGGVLAWWLERRGGAAPERPAAVTAPPGAPGESVNIPAPVRTFTGRRRELAELRSMASPGSRVVLRGVGGVGKTQLAAAHAATRRGTVQVAWWIHAGDRLSALAGLAELAARLGLADEDLERSAQRVIDHLARRRRWLLVYDDVPDPATIAGIVPPAGGEVVITSRHHRWDTVAAVLEVTSFDVKGAARYLLARTGDPDEPAARRIAARLGGLPLALEQSAAYCARTGIGLADFLDRFEHSRHILAHGAEGEGYLSVAATFKTAFDRVAGENPAAAQLLGLAAFLAPSGIPRELVTVLPRVLPRELAEAARDPLRLDEVYRLLLDTSLIGRDQVAGRFQVHPLVQEVTRDLVARRRGWRWPGLFRAKDFDRSSAWTSERWTVAAVRLLHEALPEEDAPASRAIFAALMPHAQQVLAHLEGQVDQPLDAVYLRHRIGLHLDAQGEYAEAHRHFARAAGLCAEAFGAEHPATLRSIGYQASVLRRLGDLRQARELHFKVLEIRRITLGPRNPETLASIGNLALVLKELGMLKQARELYEEEVEGCARTLPDNHPGTLTAMNNLALLLRDLGEHERARDLLTRVLAAWPGPDPLSLTAANNLASVLTALGERDEARTLYARVALDSLEAFGEEHPRTLAAVGNLAMSAGPKEAAALLGWGLRRSEAALGEEHPVTLVLREGFTSLGEAGPAPGVKG
ncbi:tetratricopeptide repeat protein [Nonomuraea sp. NPDC046570]|uniref:tetratricopeptide repeat protein n=1 Tax=Nonomuraea sp. NPDC046570 TaxID=3155255 RepID=UPI0033DFFD05